MASEIIHCICRHSTIDDIVRQTVSNYYLRWSTPWPEYNPPVYTSEKLRAKSYADPEIGDPTFKPLWNDKDDGGLNRASSLGVYDVKDGVPLNPVGRTGLRGRGVLGRWGPNHAVDAVVTRWKPAVVTERLLYPARKREILQFVAIYRSDCKEWAIPGGFVEPGEDPLKASIREFLEEATELGPSPYGSLEKEIVRKLLLGSAKNKIHDGYVDDRRNTDNAWIESTVYNFHDSRSVGDLFLFNVNAGSDARLARWTDISHEINLYANHKEFLQKVAEHHKAKW